MVRTEQTNLFKKVVQILFVCFLTFGVKDKKQEKESSAPCVDGGWKVLDQPK